MLRSGSLSSDTRKSVVEVAAVVAVVLSWMRLVGQDMNWDQQNAHVASLHWFLERSGTGDLPIADGVGGFLPALWLLPWYAAIRFDQFWVAQAILCVMGVVTLLALRRLGQGLAGPRSSLMVIGITMLGLTAGTLTELGTTMGNLPTAAFVLLGLDIGLRSFTHMSHRLLGWATLSFGLAVGLKWTNAVFFVPFALLAVIRFRRSALKTGAVLGSVGVLGVMITGWFVFLTNWQRYRNPLFPYFNSVFKSSWWDSLSWNYAPYLIRRPTDMVSYLWSYASGTARSSEIFIRDPRLLLSAISATGLLVAGFRTKRFFADPLTVLATWWLASYVLWAFQFGIHRYLIALELSGAAISLLAARRLWTLLFDRAPRWDRVASKLGAIVILCLLVFTRVPNHGRASWDFQIPRTRQVALPSDTLLVFSAAGKTSAATIQFDTRHDRVGLSFVRRTLPNVVNARLSDRLQSEASKRIRSTSKPRLLVQRYETKLDREILAELGISIGTCWSPPDAGLRLCWLQDSKR
jgi:hypothetical protein